MWGSANRSRVHLIERLTWLSAEEGAEDFYALEVPPLSEALSLSHEWWWPFKDCSCERYACHEYVGLPVK
mgnify:CR=1 FL=1